MFESAFVKSPLSDHEKIALRASSLMAVPPPLPEVQPLKGLTGVNLLEVNLTQIASYVQDVASGMRAPPQAAADCPHEDMARILHKLEKMTNIPFCRHCYALGNNCRCQRVAPQAATTLWSSQDTVMWQWHPPQLPLPAPPWEVYLQPRNICQGFLH